MSVIEVERKRELANDAELKARLREAGYHQVGTGVEIDTYYSRPDWDFLATVECLRVRQRDGFAEITYKPALTADTHSSAGVVAKPETNVILQGISQVQAANTLLDVLGMTRLCQVKKTRTTFQHPTSQNITVAIDAISGVGLFVETEIMGQRSDRGSDPARPSGTAT